VISPTPPPAPGDDPALAALAPLLLQSRRNLECGDYGQVLRLLEPLVAQHPPTSTAGAELQLLMATAWMGQGNSARAIACCRQLKRCGNPQLRSQARDLLEVLEAPSLARPRDWSITLPELSDAEALQGRLRQLANRRRAATPPAPPPPPVGPTRAPIGFALVVAVLMLVAVLLGGCMQVRGALHLSGPGRLQLGYALAADAPRPTPWQRQFAAYLAGRGFQRQRASGGGGELLRQTWQSPVLPAAAALAELTADLEQAARLAGLALPAPVLRLEERNLVLGVRQHLLIAVDLRPLAGLGGLDLALDVDPVALRAVRQAAPRPVAPLPGTRVLRWPLQAGALNSLELRCWRWSPLGVSGVAVGLLLALVLALQTVVRASAPPLPQLPA